MNIDDFALFIISLIILFLTLSTCLLLFTIFIDILTDIDIIEEFIKPFLRGLLGRQ